MIYAKNGLVIRDSVPSDIDPIAKNMRVADINEIWASHHTLPKQALEEGLKFSNICLTAELNGTPVAMFGAMSFPALHTLKNSASVWLLTTPEAEKFWVCFARVSKKVIRYFFSHYSRLYNYVDVRNTKSIQWLKWCGAKFEEPVPYGPDRCLFRYFLIERD